MNLIAVFTPLTTKLLCLMMILAIITAKVATSKNDAGDRQHPDVSFFVIESSVRSLIYHD